MFNPEINAAAIERAHHKIDVRDKAAFASLFESTDGRAFLMWLVRNGKLYDNVELPEEEGARRLILLIRRTAIDYGLMPMWMQAEKEELDFQLAIKEIIEQTEAKGED